MLVPLAKKWHVRLLPTTNGWERLILDWRDRFVGDIEGQQFSIRTVPNNVMSGERQPL
jgi:hypothetical protein